MLRRGSSSRGARGAPAGSRGSSTRGRGRGAASSSSKSRSTPKPETQKLRAELQWYIQNHGPRNPQSHQRKFNTRRRQYNPKLMRNVGPASKSDSDNSFEKDRLENAAIREQQGQLRGTTNGRGNGRGNKTVRFQEPPARVNEDTTPKLSFQNPFGSVAKTSSFTSSPSTITNGVSNPFTRPSNPFGTPTPSSSANRNPFSSSNQSESAVSNPFSFSSSNTGAASANLSSPPNGPKSNNLGGFPSSSSQSAGISAETQSTFGSGSSPTVNPFTTITSSSKLAVEIENVLRQHGIVAPSWPTSTPGDPSQKAVVEGFWQTTKAYRAKVRTCLIRNGFLDDPDKPKKLSEAIDFKGTCEGMCPEFEKITRIMEHDVQNPEKDIAPDGQTFWPSPSKMVKALARSAAGQDAPLPDDVRSPAALRRTLDYLMNEVLSKNELQIVHGFLWDRTRAIRRDFVFQQSSLSPEELLDQVYCLEQITRFHVIALHQMSNVEIVAEDFSEQQEVEQLGKALLSLVHSYEDCNAQNVQCENEAEFRAYYVLFNAQNTAILEAVQDWGWKFWGESNDIKTAVDLVEVLNNIWDVRGPLNPQSATDVAQNMYSRFFSIIDDINVSYTMACFAEIHFNKVRKAALKTILASYRKQRDQTRDWTLSKMNVYLHFDDENEIVTFGEAYGLHFEEFEDESYLSFESDESMVDPFPQLKQYHSYGLVERKRGDYSMAHAISQTVYEEERKEHDGGLFVPETISWQQPRRQSEPKPISLQTPALQTHGILQETRSQWPPLDSIPASISQPTAVSNTIAPDQSIFRSQLAAPNTVSNFSSGFKSSDGQPDTETVAEKPFIFPQAQNSTSSIFSFLGQSTDVKNPVERSSQNISSSLFTPGQNNQEVTSTVSQKPYLIAASDGRLFNGIKPAVPAPPTGNANSGSESIITTPQSLTPLDPPKDVPMTFPSSLGGFQVTSLAEPQQPAATSSPEEVTVPPPTVPPASLLPDFARWFALGVDGIVDQFTEMLVHTVLRRVTDQFAEEEEKRIREEEEQQSREEAAQFRARSLGTKYIYLWRKNAHLLWMRRKGRRARALRRQLADEARVLERTKERDVVEEFNTSTSSAGRKSLEDMLSATGVLNGVHEPERTVKNVVRREEKRTKKVSQIEAKPHTPSPSRVDKIKSRSGHRRGYSDSPVRRSTFVNDCKGGSRIHLLPNWTPDTERLLRLPQPNGVRTDYFRLKARGIITLDDGTPMANPAAINLLHEKRARELANEPEPPEIPVLKPWSWSAKSTFVDRNAPPPETPEEIEALKARARDIVADYNEKKERKRRMENDEDDEELFAQAKRIREQMAEGAAWYRSEIEKESLSRSSSAKKKSI